MLDKHDPGLGRLAFERVTRCTLRARRHDERAVLQHHRGDPHGAAQPLLPLAFDGEVHGVGQQTIVAGRNVLHARVARVRAAVENGHRTSLEVQPGVVS
jgi:hypothetical protein